MSLSDLDMARTARRLDEATKLMEDLLARPDLSPGERRFCEILASVSKRLAELCDQTIGMET